jgi:hypothetical protein
MMPLPQPPPGLKSVLDTVAKNLIDEWLAELGIQTKFETAAQACNYFKTGIMTGKEATALIMEAGYTRAQATRMLSLCYLRKIPKTLQTMPRPGTKEYQQMEQSLNS